MPVRGLEAGARAGSPAAGQDVARAHPPLARLPPRRHGLERLHAPARARVEPRGARRDGAQPGAPSRGVRPRRGRDVRPDVDGFLPVFVLDRYEGYEVRRVQDCTARRARRAGSRRTRPPCARCCPPTSSSRTTCCSAARSGRPPGRRTPSRRTARSSSTRCAATRSSSALGRGGARRRRARRSSARSTSARCSRRSAGTSTACTRCRRASTSSSGRRRTRRRARRALLDGGRARPAESGQRRGAPPRRRERRAARGVPRGRPADGRLLRQADRAEGRRRAPATRSRGSTRALVVVGLRPGARRRSRRWRAAEGVQRALHRAARAPPPAPPARACGRLRRAVGLPRGVRDGRRGGGGRRLPAGRRAPLGPRRGRRGLEEALPPELGALVAFPTGDATALHERLATLLALGRRRPGALRATVRRAVEERWSWASVAERLLDATL